jgi:uncharacterized protein YkwD
MTSSAHRRSARTIPAAVATALMAGGLVLVPAGAAVAAPEDCAYMGYGSGPDQLGLQWDVDEQWVADNINAYRTQNGLAALAPSEPLRRPTMWGSLDSATRTDNQPVSHTDSRGMGPAERAQFCGGYTGPIGEIKYWGSGGDNGNYFGSGPAALEWWKNSPGHNALLLSPDYTTFGVGWAYLGENAETGFWTVMFGTS